MAPPTKSDGPVRLFRLPPRNSAIPGIEANDCVVALRALGEDTRVRIIGLLIDTPLDVTEISKRVGVSPYNVSKHLRILREAGLLRVEKRGRRHLYALPDGLRRRAADGKVLDLGCCRFQFNDDPSHARQPAAGTGRTRLVRRTARGRR